MNNKDKEANNTGDILCFSRNDIFVLSIIHS